MERVARNSEFLKFLNQNNNKVKKIIIEKANKDQIYSICDCVLNILNGKLNVDDNKNKLIKKRRCMRKLLTKSSLKKKKKILQTGGFLQILIPAIISGLASIATGLLKNDE